MPKSKDPIRAAKLIFDEFVSRNDPQSGVVPEQKSGRAVAAGRKGGKKGGPATATSRSPEQRKESAQRAARTRWKSKKG